LESFYTTCALIPITVILGALFYGLWFMSPNTRNLKIYQQDIYQWNTHNIAAKMSNLEFKYDIFPGKDISKDNAVTFMDRPLPFEKDEIKLRNKFFYQQAYFYRQKALLNQDIPDILWAEGNLDSILA